MIIINNKVLSVCLYLLVSFVLSGCSLLQSDEKPNLSEITAAPANSHSGKKLDQWNDNTSSWRNWDITSPNNQAVEWAFQEQAIEVRLEAKKKLNHFAQSSHTLQVKIIQLTDMSGLSTLAQTPKGVGTIMSQSADMIPNAVYSETVTLAPGQVKTLQSARHQDAKFVAIVSGFAELDPTSSVRILTIPVLTLNPDKDRSWFDILTFDLFVEETGELPYVVRPATLRLDVRFGERDIYQFAARAY